MTMENKVLKLNPTGKSVKPIDAFFVSLAENLKTQSIGIVLSGTGSDGTEGLKAIKAQGGITFAQTPDHRTVSVTCLKVQFQQKLQILFCLQTKLHKNCKKSPRTLN